ncbi:hypothetical protein [Texcoconibacillus texcoconensis]|uniref:Uncharacterized protein n=1 Tax=Texcoconibacillus texcoconensis TaxID=1095777 RepID=A0A840QT54_9BACI|nr:hypothetical protein [Texcoconibacillus texcoconensis]MBB5174493.1 hypothetical protein [Texcoconibacillus texcoconensis]
MSRLSKKEEQLSETYILTELTRSVLERDLKAFQQAPVKLKQPYIALLEKTLNTISKESFKLKEQMRDLNLNVSKQQSDDTFTEYMIFCRGYVLTAKYMNTHLRNQVADYISRYFTSQDMEGNHTQSS